MMNQTDTLIEFCEALTLEDVPDEAKDHARLSLLNAVGATLGGLSSDATRIATQQMEILGGLPQAHIYGTADMTSVDRAGLVNGIAAHVLDFDDTHIPTVYHPTAPLMASIVPLAEYLGATGAEFFRAWIVGLEGGMRLANALGRSHYDLGWHITSTAGYVAAAFSSAVLLGLDRTSTRHALGIAATQSSGHRQQFGAMTKSFHAGMAGSGGVTAALLAQAGYTADSESIHGRRGLLSVMSPQPDPDALVHDLGEQWVLRENCLKPYASGVVTHPLIDVGRSMRDEYKLSVDDIAAVRLRVNPLVIELTNIPVAATGLEGKFSVRHCLAAGFVDGRGGPEQFTDDRVIAPDIVAIRDRVSVEDGGLPPMQAIAEVTLGDGQVIEIEIVRARGTMTRPLTVEEVNEKFHNLADAAIGELAAKALFHAVQDLETGPFVRLVEATGR
ncbi:MAG TPA: MmgE/PrpD family protein [Acidimicrobiales bacterium]|jgi:2-methylcitrate dehydratase PrpD|nr:MmgE/PrpD family protein [Acidimicrobiales bacterium]|tara:strand:- start:5113 stop:6444 length:1332 start_codon:yes stop_codon:yes gene_type:complete